MTRLLNKTFLALLVAAAWSPPALAEPPAGRPSFSATVVRFADADTLFVKRADGSEVKVRLHWADAPEIARRKREADQPGGREAIKFAADRWTGKAVTVTRRGESYGRMVADVSAGKESLGLTLVGEGHAQLDPRYKPPKDWLAAEAAAKKEKRGLWAAEKPVAPWDWRARQRERGREP